MLDGQTMEGERESVTRIVKEQDADCALPAVTTKVLVVVPIGKAVPLFCPVVLFVVVPVQLSVPVGFV